MVNLNKNNNIPKENIDNTNVSKQVEIKWNYFNRFCGVLISVTLTLAACLINGICFNIFKTNYPDIFILLIALFFPVSKYLVCLSVMRINTGARLLFLPKSNEMRDFSAAAFHILEGIILIMAPAMINGCLSALFSI